MVTDFLIWDTRRWQNGVSRTLLQHKEVDPYDKRVSIEGGWERKFFIDGQGTAYLSGDEPRMVIKGSNYNTKIQGKFTNNGTTSYFSMRTRSRHHLPITLDEELRFGGYEVFVSLSDIWFAREDYHENYVWYDGFALATSLLENKEYPMEFTVLDNASAVDMELKIDYGSGLTSVGTYTDTDPSSPATNRKLFENNSISWIRARGNGSVEFRIRDLKIIKVLSDT